MASTKHSQDAHDHGEGAHHAEHAHISRSTYYRVFGALMVLMALTVGAYWVEGFVEIPRGLGVLIAMAIASAKTVLIILFFMHVKIASRTSQIYAAASFVGLALLFTIIMGDYFARGWPPQVGPLP